MAKKVYAKEYEQQFLPAFPNPTKVYLHIICPLYFPHAWSWLLVDRLHEPLTGVSYEKKNALVFYLKGAFGAGKLLSSPEHVRRLSAIGISS